LSEVRHVEPLTRQDVVLAERLIVTPTGGVEPLVDVDVDLQIDVFETRAAWAAKPSVDGSFDHEHTVGLAQFQRHPNRLRECDPLERLERHFVGDHHQLAPAGEKPADVNPVRTLHK
jgi:hypothetical protein